MGAAGIATMLFYNQGLGLSASLCGVVFLISSVVDGISDPIVGACSDQFKSRWDERTSIFGYNAVTGMVGGVGFGVFLLVVVFPSTAEYSNGLLNEGRYALLAAIGAVTIVVSLFVCTFGTRAASMKGRRGWAGGGATQASRSGA